MKNVMVRLIEAARIQGLPFLVVGGHAIILHGVPRFTRDIDLLITDEYREGWRGSMEGMGYCLIHRVDAFDQYEGVAEDGRKLPGIDFMLVDHEVWEKLMAAAQSVSIAPGCSVQIPDVLHLIAMKIQAATSPNRRQENQDFSDVAELLKLNRLDLSAPVVRDTIVKYGGHGAFARLKNLI